MRIFLAHPKDYADVEALRRQLLEKLTVGATVPITIVTGATDWELNFRRFGTWDSWIYSIVHGSEYIEGVPSARFDMIIVAPGTRVGKATAQIVREACRVAKPVYFFDGNAITKVSGVTLMEDRNFHSGWSIF